MKDRCLIIGGGPSVNSIDKKKIENFTGDIIVVNKAVIDFPMSKYFITMDYTFSEKLTESEYRKFSWFLGNKIFIANLHPKYMTEKNGQFVDTRMNKIYDLSDFDVIIKSRIKEKFGYAYVTFGNGYNSGFCAIQLALLLGYKDIYLLGFDYTCQENKTHYHSGYGESANSLSSKLENYYQTLKNAILNYQKSNKIVNFYSCSNLSRLNSIIPYKGDIL